MSPPFPKGAPTLALISKSGMNLIAKRSQHKTQAMRWGLAAALCATGGVMIFWVSAVVLAAICVWHSYHLWRLRRSQLIALVKLPETPITDALDLQWLTWAQWKEPRTRAYLREKRPDADFRVCDIQDLMARMSNETDDFTKRFGDPDEAWEALEARRKQERQLT